MRLSRFTLPGDRLEHPEALSSGKIKAIESAVFFRPGAYQTQLGVRASWRHTGTTPPERDEDCQSLRGAEALEMERAKAAHTEVDLSPQESSLQLIAHCPRGHPGRSSGTGHRGSNSARRAGNPERNLSIRSAVCENPPAVVRRARDT